MEQDSILKEILNALKLHSDHIDSKMDGMKTELETKMDSMKTELETKISNLESKMDEGFTRVDHQFDQLGKKVDGIRAELNETQETVDFSASKVVQHEKKLRQISQQQN